MRALEPGEVETIIDDHPDGWWISIIVDPVLFGGDLDGWNVASVRVEKYGEGSGPELEWGTDYYAKAEIALAMLRWGLSSDYIDSAIDKACEAAIHG